MLHGYSGKIPHVDLTAETIALKTRGEEFHRTYREVVLYGDDYL